MTKLYKVAYYIGEDVNPATKFRSGFILVKDDSIYFFDPKAKEQQPLDRIYQVYTFKLRECGQILQVNNGHNYIFFFSVYFCIGGNFIITKPSQTKKLHKLLASKATVSTTSPVSTVYWQPSEMQKEKKNFWTKERHIPTPVIVMIITIALMLIFNYRIVIAAYILKFTHENNINLPEPLFNFLMKTIAEYLRDNNLLHLLHK